MEEQNSGVNTILIVVVLVLVVIGLVWYFGMGANRPGVDNGANRDVKVDVNLPPAGTGGTGGTGGTPAPAPAN